MSVAAKKIFSLALLLSAWLSDAAVAADAKSIAATVCAPCHGADGNGLPPIFPQLAGQTADYTAKQLTDYITGKRKNDAMAAVIAALKSDEVPGLAAHFAALPPSPNKAENTALIDLGKKIYVEGNAASGVPGCAGCHEANGAGSKLNPRLAGQYQTYTVSQLQAFKSGARSNDKARVMRGAVEQMNTEEMKAVAEYLAGQ
jgi:cytochrome c553